MDAMDAVLRNFKSIPCPAGDRCTTAGCQWQHSWDKNSTTDASDGVHGHALHVTRGVGLDGNQDADGPRKRIKVASGSSTGVSQPQPLTATKPVSPPPLKRKLPSAYRAPTVLSEIARKPQPIIEPSTTTSGDIIPSNVSLGTKKPPPTGQQPTQRQPPATSGHRASPIASRGNNPFASVTSFTSSKPEITTKSATPVKASRPAPIPKKAPLRKVESLNPRHLKSSAPATHDFRFKALKMLHEQFERLNNELKKSNDPNDKKLILSPQELIWLALDKEENLATDKPSIYTGLIKNQIMSLKKTTVSDWRKSLIEDNLKKQEALDAAAGNPPPKSALGAPAVINTGLEPPQEVEILQHLITPIDKLAIHGYVPTPPTAEDIARARAGEEASQGWEKCDRCDSRFQVFPGRKEDGSLTSGGRCVHHPERPYFPDRSASQTGPTEKRYRCCNGTMGEPGCKSGATHVFKVKAPSRLAALIPFVETPPNEDVPKDRAVCFDCEMGYTSRGMELIRLTATRFPDGSELLDVLVHPMGEILDLNSRYSGVLPDHIRDAVNVDDPLEARRIIKELEEADDRARAKSREITGEKEAHEGRTMKKRMQIVSSPMVARSLLFAVIAPETPLIGHGLENDLNAMRIVHPTVIDTILLFPHRRGLPLRHGLKVLARQHLNKEIQSATGVVGHDSGEDARAAGDLVRLKVGEKWKALLREGWSQKDGKICPPLGGRKRSLST